MSSYIFRQAHQENLYFVLKGDAKRSGELPITKKFDDFENKNLSGIRVGSTLFTKKFDDFENEMTLLARKGHSVRDSAEPNCHSVLSVNKKGGLFVRQFTCSIVYTLSTRKSNKNSF